MDKKPRKIIFGEKVRKAIVEGVTTTYEAVATTLGSRGRNVSIEKNWGAPLIIHDGVTVAREVILSDPFSNQAAQQVIEAAQATNNQAGDGTTTATILTYAIVTEGMKLVQAKINPQIIRKGIDRAVEIVEEELNKMAQKVEKFEEMKQVATISAADEGMGEIIATAIQKVGKHGAVTVQPGTGYDINVEYKEGMEFISGYISPYLVTDPEKQEAVLEGTEDNRPFVVVVNQKVTNSDLVQKLLQPIFNYNQSAQIIIIADDFEPDAKASLVMNRIRGNQKYVGVKSPEFGDHRTHMLMDIALVTGATVIGGSTGVDIAGIEENDLSLFGRAEKVIVTRENTMIVGGSSDEDELKKHIKGLKELEKNEKDPFRKDKIQARLAKLVGGVAVINVGAYSDTEMREKKERVYDAVNATQAAVDKGIVPGGGVSLVRASRALDKIIEKETDDKIKIGMKIVRDALFYPLKKLVDNSGGHDSGFVLETIRKSNDENLGYNVDSEAFENMNESGIIDPVKVTVSAFRNAASAASMLLTTECMIAFQREKPKENGASLEGIGDWND